MSVLNWSTKRSNSSKSSKVYAWVRLKLRILLLLVLPTKNRTRRLVSISNPFARCFSIRPTASSIRCPQLPYFHGQHLPGFFVHRERLEVAVHGTGEEPQAPSLHPQRDKPHILAFVIACLDLLQADVCSANRRQYARRKLDRRRNGFFNSNHTPKH
jgi:hypothetical protein